MNTPIMELILFLSTTKAEMSSSCTYLCLKIFSVDYSVLGILCVNIELNNFFFILH